MTFFSSPLQEIDNEIHEAINKELSRQQNQIELIASENKKLPFAKIDKDVVVAPISSTADPIVVSLSFNTEMPDAKPEKIT